NEADIGPDADGVNNIDPVNNIPDQDRADDGLLLPVRMPRCKWTNVRYLVNTVTPGIYYFNLWADWNRDGDWDDQVSGCSLGDVPEWAVRNQLLKLNAGPSLITSLPFVSWHDPNELPEQLWVRITLSDQPWEEIWGAGGCGPTAGYYYGETEDYYLTPNTSCTECADLNCDGFINLEDLAELSRQWLGSCP
ncbi:MAG TPA: GEVED domain-containing protein, partial [Anaerohalosphaeraceae bacterium]|nr:GEVED domain-containing protein [Anaerohalosphaeraceae bacterium]